MKLRFAGLALVMVAIVSFACSSNSGAPDGSAGATVNGTGGAGGMCSGVAPCGGSVVGTWTVTSSCLKVEGQLDPQKFDAKCAAPTVTGSRQVTGTWSATESGAVTDNTLTTGTEQFNLDKACLVISSTPTTCDGIAGLIKILGYQSVDCKDMAGGCACSATVHQQGGLGVVVASPDATSYATSNNTLTVSEDSGDIKYGYCAQGSTLTVSPQSSHPTVTGTIVFQKEGNSGSGGSAGTTGGGGQTGSGGTIGNGGGTGLGGNGSGGTSAAGTGGATGASGSAGSAGTPGNAGPCDIYKSGGTPCVAAHSPVRALSSAYGGKLYQLRNSAGTTKDINAVTPGGAADAAAQSTFCMGTTCSITVIYDQTGHGLDLTYEGNGSPLGGLSNVQPASATKEPIKLGGNSAYGLWLDGGKAYWVDGSMKGMPLGKEPEAMYMVTSGTHSGGGCCFDYGNAGTGRVYAGPGTMDALNFSSTTLWGKGAGAGPWVMADLEGGLYTQNDKGTNAMALTQTTPFVTAMLKNNGTTEFAIRRGNAASGELGTSYKGALPNGYNPMKKQGGFVLGSGGDCCKTNMNLAVGTFYEGCVVSGYPSDATEDAVQANIVAAKYSK